MSKKLFLLLNQKPDHMKILKRVGIGLLLLFLLLIVISFFLPRKMHIERSVEMSTAPSAPYSLVNNLKAWYDWSPWHKIDPNTKWTFGEKTEGVGAWYSW